MLNHNLVTWLSRQSIAKGFVTADLLMLAASLVTPEETEWQGLCCLVAILPSFAAQQ